MGVATRPRGGALAWLDGTIFSESLARLVQSDDVTPHSAGRYDLDCSQYLLLSTGGVGNTSELGAAVSAIHSIRSVPLEGPISPAIASFGACLLGTG